MAEIPKHPKKSAGDVAQGLVKAAVSGVPIVGGPAAELVGMVFGPPLEKRREKWMDDLATVVEELQDKVEGLTPEKLSQDEAFVTVALRATEIAIRTHQQEKLDALRNAVRNTGLRIHLDETVQQIFLNHVDTLTPWHLRVLKVFQDPHAWAQAHNINFPNWGAGSPSAVLEVALPDLAGNREFYDQLVSDLKQRGLMTNVDIHTAMTGHGMFQSRTSRLGNDFLRFIS
jgi:hypothetical protein